MLSSLAQTLKLSSISFLKKSSYINPYILLDGLVCSIVGYFYELRSILASYLKTSGTVFLNTDLPAGK